MNRRYGSIYLVTNVVTGDQYVGQTIKSVSHRWKAHCRAAMSSPSMEISRHIACYGEHMFAVDELFVAYDKVSLDNAERELIARYKPALNRTRGGAGSPRTLSDAERDRIRQRMLANWKEPEWREKTTRAIRAAERRAVPYEVLRRNGERVCERRWAGHVKHSKQTSINRSEIIRATWEDPEIRARRIGAIKAANARSDVREKRSASMAGRRLPSDVVDKIARAKWRPVFCPELLVSFLSQKHAAAFLGVASTAVSNAVKLKGKVGRRFTLVRVA